MPLNNGQRDDHELSDPPSNPGSNDPPSYPGDEDEPPIQPRLPRRTLPRFTITKFTGDRLYYPSFKACFMAIIGETDMAEERKAVRLLMLLEGEPLMKMQNICEMAYGQKPML